MSQNKDTSENHKFLDSPTLRNHHHHQQHHLFSPKFIKWLAFLILLASISFIFFSAFSNQSTPRWFSCPVCLAKNSNSQTISNDIEHFETPISSSFPFSPTNISHIVFGIGGSVSTWKQRRKYSELWWKPNLTRGYVWLDGKPNKEEVQEGEATSPPYRVSEDTKRFKYGLEKRSAIRISRIVVESYRLLRSSKEEVRWFVMGDDDTVFFTENLVTILSRYDHNQMYYIGGNSESVEQDEQHSYGMAYGGGGFAISYSLAKQLDKTLDACLDRYADYYGSDERVASCVNEIGVPLTKNLGFHQFDIRGNPYGLLAAHPVTPLVSLHHLDAVTPLFPNDTRLDSLKYLLGAYKVDPGRILQQSFCHDLERNWTFSVSWGYTIQIYPILLTSKVLESALLTFKTWRSWTNGPFIFNTRPISADACERPLIYFLDAVDELGNGETITSYKRFVGETGLDCPKASLAVHRVNISATTMEANKWKKAPRRHCCEIINQTDGIDSAVLMRTRSCKPSESVSIPISP